MTTPTQEGALVRTEQVGQLAPQPRVNVPATWDPFQTMDRLDEEALQKEVEGIAAKELVYVVKDGGQEVVGLSKVGVDECCMMLVSQGQVIREEDLQHYVEGEGEDREAVFKCRAARYAVSPQGEVKLDQVIGVKRQALYYDAAEQLTLDSTLRGGRHRGKTYRQMLEDAEGRDYLGWMAENYRDEAVRVFVQRLLAGEEAMVQPGRQFNPHWYEQGAMKAARNARFRLIPGKVRAAVIASARSTPGAVREVERPAAAPATQQTPQEPRLDEATAAACRTVFPGKAGSWGGYAGRTMGVVPTDLLEQMSAWALEKQQEFRMALDDQEGLPADKRQEFQTSYARMGDLSRKCNLVAAARKRGQLVEPPHKDGTPRQQQQQGGADGQQQQ